MAWKNCNFYGNRVYQFGLLNKMNPDTYDTVWDSSNDYSYSDLISFEDDNDAAAVTKKVTAYVDGELVWGDEPENGVYPLGDVNLDCRVDADDAVLLQKYLAGKKELGEKNLTQADMNSDGKADVFDLVSLKRTLNK